MARHSFSHLSAGIAITLLSFSARPTAGQNFRSDRATLERWIGETDAHLNFVGAPRGGPINPFDARVIWCSRRKDNICGGTCTVYTGPGDQCIQTDATVHCLAATHNITFCSTKTCSEHCNAYAVCGVRMDSGFCWTPNTSSIQIPIVTEELSVPAADDAEPVVNAQTITQPFQLPGTNSPIPLPSGAVIAQPNSVPPIFPSASSIPRAAFPHIETVTVSPIVFSNAPAASGSDLPASAAPSEEGSNALPVGAIAGIVLGVVFMLAASICAVMWLRYKTRRRSRPAMIDSSPRPFLAPSPASSSQPIPLPYQTESPVMQQSYPSPPTDYDMESMYTSNPGYPMTVSSISYATTPSQSHVPIPRSGPLGTKGHDRAPQPVKRIEEDVDLDDDGRSFGHYLVNSNTSSRTPHRLNSADVRHHYSNA